MVTRDRAIALFQSTYYNSVDAGDMERAVAAFHDDVDWSHAQVWAHHGFARQGSTHLRGREAVAEFLSARKDQLAEARIRHRIVDLILDGDRGAFLGEVEGEDGRRLPFIVWFEMKDDLVSRYTLRPI